MYLIRPSIIPAVQVEAERGLAVGLLTLVFWRRMVFAQTYRPSRSHSKAFPSRRN